MASAPPIKEVVAVKITFKKLGLTIDFTKIDWNLLIKIGTFFATLYSALK